MIVSEKYINHLRRAIDLQMMAAILGAGKPDMASSEPETNVTADDLIEKLLKVQEAIDAIPPCPFNGATLIRAGEEAYEALAPVIDKYNDDLSLLPRIFLAKDRHQQPWSAVGINGFDVVFRFDGRK